jgi:hypothetical protein
MPQPNDLSRSLVALDQDSTIIAVVEMSQSSWLVERARQLGWAAVEVIDDDLGRSGGGINRPGFRSASPYCRRRLS